MLRSGEAVHSRLKSRNSCRGIGFKCPLCGSIHKSLLALRLHVKKGHGELWSRCPICNQEFKYAINHYRRMDDDKHRELWFLTVSSRNAKRSIRKIAEMYGGMFTVKNDSANGYGW
jgi:uncharacterized C2H2 Zn-finger protein